MRHAYNDDIPPLMSQNMRANASILAFHECKTETFARFDTSRRLEARR